MNDTILSLFNAYKAETGDASAAGSLVLAQVMTEQGGQDKGALTAEQVAERLQVDVKTVRGYCTTGKLRHTRVGRHIRVRPEWLAEYEKLGTKAPKRLSRHFA